jgi:probable HAF family extracellular repeat protein
MKSKLLLTILLAGLSALLAMPVGLATTQGNKSQPGRYTITDLGTLPGGPFSTATNIANNGLITGIAALPDYTQHAVLWQHGQIIDIGTPGAGGPNSGAFSVNERGQISLQAESSATDPNNENFCAYGTGLKCLPFLWQNGVMTPLPLLGGNNGTVGQINSRGEVVGVAENGTVDSTCPPGVAFTGTGPQVLDYEAVIWGPKSGQVRELRPLEGDTVGMALWINDEGQAVGGSGLCSNTVLPPIAFAPHAVLWEKDGSARDLGNLGSAVVNMALAINNHGQVVGGSSKTPDATVFNGTHAFLWTREKGMRDLGTLPGDVASAGGGINDEGVVVGLSAGPDGGIRAFVWKDGVMTDLNTLVTADSPLFLLSAGVINSSGEIVGFGVTEAGEVHGFLATPTNDGHGERHKGTRADLSDDARKALRQLRFGPFGSRR